MSSIRSTSSPEYTFMEIAKFDNGRGQIGRLMSGSQIKHGSGTGLEQVRIQIGGKAFTAYEAATWDKVNPFRRLACHLLNKTTTIEIEGKKYVVINRSVAKAFDGVQPNSTSVARKLHEVCRQINPSAQPTGKIPEDKRKDSEQFAGNVDQDADEAIRGEPARAMREQILSPSTSLSPYRTDSINDFFEGVPLREAFESQQSFIDSLKTGKNIVGAVREALDDDKKIFTTVYACATIHEGSDQNHKNNLGRTIAQLPQDLRQKLADAAQNDQFRQFLKSELGISTETLDAVQEQLNTAAQKR